FELDTRETVCPRRRKRENIMLTPLPESVVPPLGIRGTVLGWETDGATCPSQTQPGDVIADCHSLKPRAPQSIPYFSALMWHQQSIYSPEDCKPRADEVPVSPAADGRPGAEVGVVQHQSGEVSQIPIHAERNLHQLTARGHAGVARRQVRVGQVQVRDPGDQLPRPDPARDLSFLPWRRGGNGGGGPLPRAITPTPGWSRGCPRVRK